MTVELGWFLENDMSTEFSDEDMADLGRALMKAIDIHVPGGWHPAECPSEIVGDLVGELGELRLDAERYRKLRDEETWGDDTAEGGWSRWTFLGELSGKEFDKFVDALPPNAEVTGLPREGD